MTNNQYKFMILTGKYLPEENIKYDGDYYFECLDSNGNQVYYEDSDGYWYKKEYNNKEVYYENSTGYWEKYDYDSDHVYFEDSDGYWFKKNNNGTVIESGNHNDKCI